MRGFFEKDDRRDSKWSSHFAARTRELFDKCVLLLPLSKERVSQTQAQSFIQISGKKLFFYKHKEIKEEWKSSAFCMWGGMIRNSKMGESSLLLSAARFEWTAGFEAWTVFWLYEVKGVHQLLSTRPHSSATLLLFYQIKSFQMSVNPTVTVSQKLRSAAEKTHQLFDANVLHLSLHQKIKSNKAFFSSWNLLASPSGTLNVKNPYGGRTRAWQRAELSFLVRWSAFTQTAESRTKQANRDEVAAETWSVHTSRAAASLLLSFI